MSTKKLSTKPCRQNEFDQIRCRPISSGRSVYRQNVCRQNTLSTNDMQFRKYCEKIYVGLRRRRRKQLPRRTLRAAAADKSIG